MENHNDNNINTVVDDVDIDIDDWLSQGTATDDYTGRELNGDFDGDGYFRNLPPGFRFQPTDEELTNFYLENKLLNRELPKNRIFDVNIYDFHPKTLSETYEKIREDGWYFFTGRCKKYPKGLRPNRAAKDGFWKPTGRGKSIPSEDNEMWVRNSLDFYDGNHKKPTKSLWKMHEFILGDNNVIRNERSIPDGTLKLDDFILCRIYINKNKKKKDAAERSCGKSESAVSYLESSQHIDNVSSLVIDEDKLNSTSPVCQVQKSGEPVWYDDHTSYIENSAQYQANRMDDNQNNPFSSTVGTAAHHALLPLQQQEARKQVWHGNSNGNYHGFVPYQEPWKQVSYGNNHSPQGFFSNTVGTVPYQEPEKQVWNEGFFSNSVSTAVAYEEPGKQVLYGNNNSTEGFCSNTLGGAVPYQEPEKQVLYGKNNSTEGVFRNSVGGAVAYEEPGKQVLYGNNYCTEVFCSNTLGIVPYQESEKQVPYGNNNSAEGLFSNTVGAYHSYEEDGKRGWYEINENPAQPMNNSKHMISPSVNSNDTMNQLTQPPVASQNSTDEGMNAEDLFLANYTMPQLDEDTWLDNNLTK